MQPEEYIDLLSDLGLDIREGADAIGIHRRTSYRYALGEQRIPLPVAKLLRLLRAHDKVLRLLVAYETGSAEADRPPSHTGR